MMKLNIQYFAETSNDIGIRITLDPSTFNTNLAKLRKQITAFQTNINAIKLEDNFSESLSKVSKVLENSEAQLELYTKALSEVKRQMSAVEKAHEEGEISTAEYEKQMTSLIVTQESYKKNISNVKKEIKNYKDIQESATLTGKTFGKRLSEIDSELLKIDKSFNRSVTHLTNWEETTEGLNNKIGSLNKSLTQHKKRLETLTDEYDRINLKGKASKEVKDKLIQEINKEYQAIAKTKSEMKKYTDSLNDTERKLKEVERTIESLNREYEKEIKVNGTRTKKAKEIREEVKKQVKEYQRLENELEDTNEAQEKTNKGWTIGKQILADMTRTAIHSAINGFKNLTKAVFDSSISFESAFAGIRKTVDATEEELQGLETEILELSKRVPTTANELARVGEIAGQLGIETENIAEFVEVITGMSVAFEGVNADEAAMSLAKFANITKMSQTDYEKLGSVITELGNNYAATEGDIIEMATRIAATGEVVGLSEADIMGLSTAISSVGVEAEAGGTAISKLLKQMNTTSQGYASANDMISKTGHSLRDLELMASNNSTGFKKLTDSLGLTQKELKNSMTISRKYENFAKTAGVSTEELSTIMKDDAVKAMAMFIDGLNDTERNGKNAVEILNDMGLTEVRLSNTILALAGSEQELVDVVGTANKAWKEGTALQKEVDKRYETTESKIQMLKNSFNALSITLFKTFKESFIGAVSSIQKEMEGLTADLTGNKGLKKKLADAGKAIGNIVTTLFKALRKLLPSLLDFVTEMAKLGQRIIPLVVKTMTPLIKLFTKVATWMAKNEEIVIGLVAGYVAYNVATKASIVLTKGYQIAQKLVAVATKKATVAQLGLNAAMNLNPVGLIAGAIGLAVTAIGLYINKTKEAEEVTYELSEATQEAIDTLNDVEKARDEAIESAVLETESLKDLAYELQTITDENGKVTKGNEKRAKFITSTLSEALGIEIELTDGIIKNYQDIQKEIDKTIEKKHALAVVESQEESYNTAQAFLNDQSNVEKYNQAKKDYETQKQFYDDYKKDMEDLEKAYNHYLESGGITPEGYDWSALEKYGIKYNQIGKIDTLYQEWSKNLRRFKEDAEKTEKEFNELDKVWSGHLANVTTYTKNLEHIANGEYDKVTWDTFEAQIDAMAESSEKIELVNSRVEALTKGASNLNEKYKTATGDLKVTIGKQIEKYVKDLMATRDELQTAYDNATTEADRKAYADALETVDKQINTYIYGAEEIRQITLDMYSKQISDATNKKIEFQDAGNGLVQAMINGVATGSPFAVSEMDRVIKGMNGQIDSKDNIETTKSKTQKIIDNIVAQPKTNTNKANLEGVSKFIGNLISSYIDKDEKGNNRASKPAENFLSGLVNTFKNSPTRSTLANVVIGLGSSLSKWLNKGQDAHSPSKKAIQSASYFMSGIYKGILDDEDKILKEVKTFGETLTGTLQDSLGQVRANVSGSVDLGGQVHANGTATSGTTNNNSKVVNWTQNYTTPRPMSRYDMYIENKRVKNQILQEMNAQS